MQDQHDGAWQQIAEKVSTEQDATKLTKLVQELIQAIDERNSKAGDQAWNNH